MPKGPAARINDLTVHPGALLTPGPPSMNVMIGKQFAWLGMTPAAAAALAKVIADGAKEIADKTADVAKATALPPSPASAVKQTEAAAALVKATADAATNTAAAMTMSGVSMNACPVVKVAVPDGIGVVIMPSQTVFINKWGACRVGDMIQEVTSVNSIAPPCCPTVIIGG